MEGFMVFVMIFVALTGGAFGSDQAPQEAIVEDVDFQYTRINSLNYSFTATMPENGKYWEWKFSDEKYWEGYEDKSSIRHKFSSSGYHTIKLRILDANENIIDEISKTINIY